MARYFSVTIISAVFLFGILLLSPPAALAAYNTVTFSSDTTTSLWGIPLNLTVSSGSNVASITVNSNNLSIGMEANSSITLTDSSRHVLTNSKSEETTCNSTYSRITITTYGIETVTVTPSDDICGTVPQGGGGGGGGGGATVTPPPTTEALPTQTVAANDVAVTAAAGGTVEATTDQGTRAKIVLPANAVTANATVDITPTQTTAASIATQAAAVPAAQSVVGGYVYDYSVAVGTQAVSTFSTAVTISFTYTDTQISGLKEDTLKVAYYDTATAKWVELTTTVDKTNNKVTATVTHLTLFALLGEKTVTEAATTTVPVATTTPTTPTTPTAPVTKPISQMTIAELKAEITRIAGLIAQLQQELLKLIGGNQLTQNLKYGDKSEQVKLLQTWLARDKAVYPEGVVSSWFGPKTKAAVIAFQEKYAAEVLIPLNLTKGTGYVGASTRAKLNALYGGQ